MAFKLGRGLEIEEIIFTIEIYYFSYQKKTSSKTFPLLIIFFPPFILVSTGHIQHLFSCKSPQEKLKSCSCKFIIIIKNHNSPHGYLSPSLALICTLWWHCLLEQGIVPALSHLSHLNLYRCVAVWWQAVVRAWITQDLNSTVCGIHVMLSSGYSC